VPEGITRDGSGYGQGRSTAKSVFSTSMRPQDV
jgi:hypothetical protein